VWGAKTGADLLTLKGHTGRVSSATFSPDGSRIVTRGDDGTVKVWDAKSGATVLTLKGELGSIVSLSSVFSVSFSPDGSRIVTGSTGQMASVWDATPVNREFSPNAAALPPRVAK
jgi:eukaryotic-like serine/threonine-protein kinase